MSTAALPDGHLKGEPLADGISPNYGSDEHGPTAVMKSVACIDHVRCGNGVIFNQKISPTAVSSEEGMQKWAIVEGNYPKEQYSHMNYSVEDYIAVCSADHHFIQDTPTSVRDLLPERLLVRENGSGTRNILEENLLARGLKISDFIHFTEVENMHTIIGLLKKDCGISFMYKIAVIDELQNHILKEIQLTDFKMQHDFDFIWEKESIYTDRYISICKELLEN